MMRMQIGQGDTPTVQHPDLGPVRFHARELGPFPDRQVALTIDVMRERAGEDAADPVFKSRAQGLAGAGSDLDKTGRLWQHVKRSIKFSRDEPIAAGLNAVLNPDNVVEIIIRPCDMARYVDQGIAIGDCDDFSMYLAALLTANGIACSFITVAADGHAPDQYSHVYVVAYPDGERVACDASHGGYPGWEVPNAFGKIREWQCGGAGADWFTDLLMLAGISVGGWLAYRTLNGRAA